MDFSTTEHVRERGDQSPFELQLPLGTICVFCVLAHVLLSKNPFTFRFYEKLHQISANETKLLNDCVWEEKHAYIFPLWRPIPICITSVIGDHLIYG